MKKIIVNVIVFTSISLSAVSFAEDYSLKTNDELFGMKDQVRVMDASDRDAYRTERQSRMGSMDQTERDARFSDMGASGKRNMENNGQGQGSRKRDGSGGGQGKGGGQGNGKQHRYGQNGGGGGGGGRGQGGGRYGSGR